MQVFLKVILLCVMTFLYGCSHSRCQKIGSPFLSVPSSFYEKRITHLVEVNTAKNREVFLVVADIHEEEIQWVAVTTMGMTLISMDYTSQCAALDVSPLYSGILTPSQLFIGLQMVGYEGYPMVLNENWRIDNEGDVRTLRFNEDIQLSIKMVNKEDSALLTGIVKFSNNISATVSLLSIEDI